MNTKRLGPVTIKSADEGLVTAIFSTFDVLDHDNEVVRPGAFTDGAPVRISAYNHTSWGGSLPVGKGFIRTTDKEAVLEGQFFLDTTLGRDTFATVKALGDLGEWSYSLHDVTSEPGEWAGEPCRILKAITVHEVSPVLRGASVGTRTLSMKSGLTFATHLDTVLADVVALNERAAEVMALRAAKGGRISEASLKQLELIAAQLKALDELLGSGEEGELMPTLADECRRQYLRFLSLTTH